MNANLKLFGKLTHVCAHRQPPSVVAAQVASQEALKQDRKAYSELLKECIVLQDSIAGNMADLVANSFSPKLQGQQKPYDAMLEEFKWLQALPSESLQTIQNILPPGGVGTNDKFNSQSTVSLLGPLCQRRGTLL